MSTDLRIKFENSNNQAQSSTPSVFNKAFLYMCKIVSLENHISRNSSSFSFISSPKIHHPIIVANGSKVASQGIDQVSLFPIVLTTSSL